MAETGSLKLFKNRPGSVQEKCCLKIEENFDLTLFWYSPYISKYLHAFKNLRYTKHIPRISFIPKMGYSIPFE
jgi:hypothetical protein